MKNTFDVIIVGSGPAGTKAAFPLIESGLSVAIVDAGLDSKKQIRRSTNLTKTNSNASRLLKNSSYVFKKTYELLPIESNIEIVQSLAKGGLSEIWKYICDYFTEDELNTIGLPSTQMHKEYRLLSHKITLNKEPDLHYHSAIIRRKAEKKIKNKVTIRPLAISYYQGSKRINELKKYKNFTYIPGFLVKKVTGNTKFAEIECGLIEKGGTKKFRARYIILAAGSINTTRILLNSLRLYNQKTTFLTKDSYILVCLNINILTKEVIKKNNNHGQIEFLSKKKKDNMSEFFIQFYPCNPHVLMQYFKFIPLPKKLLLFLCSLIARCIVIADIRFPSINSEEQYIQIRKETLSNAVFQIEFSEKKNVTLQKKKNIKRISHLLKSIQIFPLKIIHSEVTSHYAGGVPFSQKPGLLTCHTSGKLHQIQRIYVADSATWNALPACPPTLTIMANASRIAKEVLKNF